MTAAEIISASRTLLNDVAQPYKWTDTELLAYLNDSLNTIARETDYFIDTYTSSVINITIATNTQDYAISTNVLNILNAKLLSESVNLTHSTSYEMNNTFPMWRYIVTTNDSTDTPTRYITDYRTGYISLYPCPDASNTLVLQTIRRTSSTLSSTETIGDITATTNTPDIRSDFHFGLVDGIIARACLKIGINVYDYKRSISHFALFNKLLDSIKRDMIKRNAINKTITPHFGML
jgi:hypothetical protein